MARSNWGAEPLPARGRTCARARIRWVFARARTIHALGWVKALIVDGKGLAGKRARTFAHGCLCEELVEKRGGRLCATDPGWTDEAEVRFSLGAGWVGPQTATPDEFSDQ